MSVPEPIPWVPEKGTTMISMFGGALSSIGTIYKNQEPPGQSKLKDASLSCRAAGV